MEQPQQPINEPQPSPIPVNRPNPDFNYPYPNRVDLMSLSTINSRDAPLKKFKQLDTNRDWSVNLYNLDIAGTSPRRVGAFNQKIDYINKNDDIERSSPKLLHIGLNKPEYNLSNKDIEYSSPGCVKIKTTRHLNPLEPKYNISKCEPLPFEAPKFIRDNIQIADIDGAKPKKIMSKWLTRESLKKDDIKDSSPRKPYVRKTNYSSVDYRDVTHSEFRSGRLTNPLEPVYRLGYVTGEKIQIGPIDGNKPVVFSRYKYDEPYNLKVNDIIGANVGSKNYINKFTGQNFIYTSKDIFGAQTGTLKKGIVTMRHVNPLVPKYQYLGREELQGLYENNPYNNLTRLSKTTIPGKKSDKLKQGMGSEGAKVNNVPRETSKMAEAGGNIIVNNPVNPVNTAKPQMDSQIVPNSIMDKTMKVLNPETNNQAPIVPQEVLDKTMKKASSPKSIHSPEIAPTVPDKQAVSHSPNNSPRASKIASPNQPIERKNSNPVVPPTNQQSNLPEDHKFELADVPYVEDVVRFDKDKFVKPKPFYGFVHDDYIMPPIEGISRKEVTKSIAEMPNGAAQASKVKMGNRNQPGNMNKSTSFNSCLPSFPQTYAQKLDQFMNKTNLKMVEPGDE